MTRLYRSIPDPADFDEAYRREVWAIAGQRKGRVKLSEEDRRVIGALSRDDFFRALKRRPVEALKAYIKRKMPEISDENLQGVVDIWKKEAEEDPLALLQPLLPGKAETQVRMVKGFNVETGLFIASLMGAVICTDMDAMWDQLHELDVERRIESAPEWKVCLSRFAEVEFPLALEDALSQASEPIRIELRGLLRKLLASVDSSQHGVILSLQKQIEHILIFQRQPSVTLPSTITASAHLEVSIPTGGFKRVDVSRLLVTYGRAKQIRSAPLAFLMRCQITALEDQIG